jgi:hypothetical protein
VVDLCRARRLVVSDPEILGGDPVSEAHAVPMNLIAETPRRKAPSRPN